MYPFTPSQWRELEQQALIFKYLACGLPIPPDLILHVKKSFLLDMSIGPNPTLGFLSPQIPTGFTSSDGWASMQMGFGRRREDPEPGRCRRTDGKKWRCSKEVFADSKYCERHMHRGKNRSRKLVELSLATNTTNAYSSSSSSSPYSLSKNPNHIVGMSLDNLGGYYGVEKKRDEEKLCKLDRCESKRNGFWWESNESQKNRTLDLTLDGKPNQFVLGSNFIKTEIAEKPKSFHCFFD